MHYPEVLLHIAGAWEPSRQARTFEVINPASGEVVGSCAHAGREDLDRALEATQEGFAAWRKVPAFDRSRTLRRAAGILRSRVEQIAPLLTTEQGKPLAEARTELAVAAEIIEWFAEEARRLYGRLIPARLPGVQQLSLREPVGPVAAFSPWNFPVNQANRKIAGALAAGCSIVLKGPEETPASCAELVRAFVDAGLPRGALQLVYGTPSEISQHLIAHPAIRKVSFTGSTAVGKHLASLAGSHMKRATMELGGHAPAIVFEDADLQSATRALIGAKFRNAGQVCISPTRFMVQESVFDAFVDGFAAAAGTLKVGSGLQEGVQMGPLANPRRVQAMETFIADAVQKGAEVRTGGARIGNTGNFFAPTVLSGATDDMRAMNEEPFGPLAMFSPFKGLDDVLVAANRLPYGLASYAFTRDARTMAALGEGIEAGMVSINHIGLGLAETPFGGIQDSGYGSEGGTEALESYLNVKFVTTAVG